MTDKELEAEYIVEKLKSTLERQVDDEDQMLIIQGMSISQPADVFEYFMKHSREETPQEYRFRKEQSE